MTSKKVPNNINGYDTNRFLGKGSFSYVYECSKNNKKYALKRINSEERFLKCAVREIEFLKNIDNNFVVNLKDDFIENDIQYLVFEYLEDNLYQRFFKKKIFPDFKKFSKYSYQIAEGLSYLHSKSIIHCDLKLENVMIDQNDNLKIIDLGSSIYENTNIKTRFYVQSRYYRAPEVLYEIDYSTKIDVWSYGIMLTEIIFRTCIFNGKDNFEMVYKISDYLGIPNLNVYKNSKNFNKFFQLRNEGYVYNFYANKYRVKGYREYRLEDHLVQGLKKSFEDICDYQIENTVSLIHKIFDYNYDTRLSAEQCKMELTLLENEFQ